MPPGSRQEPRRQSGKAQKSTGAWKPPEQNVFGYMAGSDASWKPLERRAAAIEARPLRAVVRPPIAYRLQTALTKLDAATLGDGWVRDD